MSKAQVFGKLVLIAVSIEPMVVQADSSTVAGDTMIRERTIACCYVGDV